MHIKLEQNENINKANISLLNPSNLKEFVVCTLIINLGSRNIHRMEIAYKIINIMCINDNEVLMII